LSITPSILRPPGNTAVTGR